MPAPVAEPGAMSIQLTWADDALHLWGIHAQRGEPLGQVELLRLLDRFGGRHIATASMPSRLVVELPEPTGTTTVAAFRLGLTSGVGLDQLGGAVSGRLAAGVGRSVRWFLAVDRLANAVVEAGRIRPVLGGTGPAMTARWAMVAEPALDQLTDELATWRPASAASRELTTPAILDRFVDAIARTRLADRAWRPPPPLRGRGTDYRAAQSAFRALVSASGAVLYRTEDLSALQQLARRFDAELHRSSGERVLAAQLRLALPTEADEPWHLGIEVVDLDRPERWCTADDVHEARTVATDLVPAGRDLSRLVDIVAIAGRQLAVVCPELAHLGVDPARTIDLDLDEVEAFLAVAPDRLDELGITLLGPEQLVRTKAGVRGSATPRSDTSSGTGERFGASALVTWEATVDDEPVDAAQLERAAQAGASLLHVNGRWVRLDASQVRQTLTRLQREREQHSELDVAGVLRLAAESQRAAAAGGAPVGVDGDGWVAELLAGLPDERLVETLEPASFTGTLRHYQRRGLSWMTFLARLGVGGCLADDMGLGKTATTLAHLAERPGPHLVVCPLSVVHNWSAEAARFTPHLTVTIHHGGERVRTSQAFTGGDPTDDEQRLFAGSVEVRPDIVVTTYGLLARDVELLSEITWDTIVLDEAQQIKNHTTRAARAVRQIPARQRFALTGTPVENHLGELWAILDAVNPGLLGSAKGFQDRFAKPIQRDQDPEATAALRALTQPFVLRRTKADKTLLPELPDKIEQVAWATLTREQATMYQAVVDQLVADAEAVSGMKRRGLVLAALTRLKQICNHPAHAAGDGSRLAGRSGKLIRFDEIVDDLLAAGERALVFTQFKEMGLLLQRHLHERPLPDDVRERLGEVFAEGAPFLHGGVSRTGRDRMVARFQSGEGPPLLIVSLKAGGTGLNLTAASQVIHYDRWWNPAVEDQATDRAWRLGQSHTVLVHKLVCEGTLEERIGELIDDKKRLAASVLGTGEQWLTELSTDDLRALVSLTPGTSAGQRGSGTPSTRAAR